MARRKRKKRRRARRKPLLRKGALLLAIAIMLAIAGFITRRVFIPRAMHFLQYRPVKRAARHEQPRDVRAMPGAAVARAENSRTGARPAMNHAARDHSALPTDRITERDRRTLDEVLRKKSK